MRGSLTKWAILAAAVMMPTAALAQASAITQPTTLTFTGVVDPNIANSIQIRQPDGSYTPYLGTLPGNFPYQPNQAVSITMQANVPTPAYLQSAALSAGNVPANGVYTFPVYAGSSASGGPTGQVTSGPVISGGLQLVNPLGAVDGTDVQAFMQYNANTGKYALANVGSYPAMTISSLGGAGFTYDPATATVATCTGAGAANNCAPLNPPTGGPSDGAYTLSSGTSANGGTISSFAARIWDSLGNIVGQFTLQFDGAWTVTPTSPGTDVPEPGMFGLFGSGVAALMMRRCRVRR